MGDRDLSDLIQPPQRPFSTVAISIVVARKDQDLFCCTDERQGWYLPAGRVDFGETFETAAKREALEEAALDVVLTGIMRFEYSYERDFMRLRCIYGGVPRDPNRPLKSVADDETYGAAWMKIPDLIKIGRGDSDVQAIINGFPYRQAQKKRKGKDKLRGGLECVKLFSWAKEGTTLFPCSIYKGIDGVVDNKRVEAQLNYCVQLVVKNAETGKYLLLSQLDSSKPWSASLPAQPIGKLEHFKTIAKFLAYNLSESLGKGIKLKLEGICGITHTAPPSLSKNSIGQFIITYYAVTKDKSEAIDEASNASYMWLATNEILARQDHELENAAEAKRVIANVEDGVVAPIEFLVWEGSKYGPL